MAFLSKLSDSIGLTVSSLFVIDQTVILSVRFRACNRTYIASKNVSV